MNEWNPYLADSKPYSKTACSNFGNEPKSLQGTTGLPPGDRPSVWTQNPYLADAGPLGMGPEGPHHTIRTHTITWGTIPNHLRERLAFLQATSLPAWAQNLYLVDAGPVGTGPEGPHPKVRAHAVTSGTNPNPLRERPAFLQATGLREQTLHDQ